MRATTLPCTDTATSDQLRRRRGTGRRRRHRRQQPRWRSEWSTGTSQTCSSCRAIVSSEAVGGLLLTALLLSVYFAFVLLPTDGTASVGDIDTRPAFSKRRGNGEGDAAGLRLRQSPRNKEPPSTVAVPQTFGDNGHGGHDEQHNQLRPRHGRQRRPNSQRQEESGKPIKKGGRGGGDKSDIVHGRRHRLPNTEDRTGAAGARAMPKKHRRIRNDNIHVPNVTKAAAQRRRIIMQHDAEMTRKYDVPAATIGEIVFRSNRQAMRKDGGDSVLGVVNMIPPSNYVYLGDSFPDDATRGGTHATLPIHLDITTENQGLGISLWVYPSSTGRVKGSRTIFSTIPSGCGNDVANKEISGLRLYINSKGTADEQLVLEYTTRNDMTDEAECALLKSLGSQVPVAVWTHVGIGIDSFGAITIYIDGKAVAKSDYGKEHNVISTSLLKSVTTRIGQGIEGGEDVLDGTVAFLVIWKQSRKEYISSSDDASWKDTMSKAYGSGLDETKLRGVIKPEFIYRFDSSSMPSVREIMQGLDGSVTVDGHYLARHNRSAADHGSSRNSFEPQGGGRYPEYKDGEMIVQVTSEMKVISDAKARERRERVRGAIRHAWAGYEKYAYGFDELLPISEHGQNNWGGLGVTLIDSLDTLWLAGMRDEFLRARNWVRDHLSFDSVEQDASVFEVTIRCLGGLLSAYDLSGDQVFLSKADDLGSRLMGAFTDLSSQLPYDRVFLKSGEATKPRAAGRRALSLSEVATLQLEFRYLSKLTGKNEYGERAQSVYELLESLSPEDGLYPIHLQVDSGDVKFGTQISFGALGDSAYEYFLKTWIQGGKKEHHYRHIYDKAIQGLHEKLLERSVSEDLLYVAEMNGGRTTPKMEHLTCFLPGLLALGAYTYPNASIESDLVARDMKSARALAYTCYQM